MKKHQFIYRVGLWIILAISLWAFLPYVNPPVFPDGLTIAVLVLVVGLLFELARD